MTIIEAIKSGQPFRRRGSAITYASLGPGISSVIRPMFTREELLADDWEIEEEKVTITRKQLIGAIYEVGTMTGAESGQVAKLLGFKE